MPLSLSWWKLPTTPKGCGRVALLVTVLIGSVIGFPLRASGHAFDAWFALSMPICLGFVAVLFYGLLDQRKYSECLYTALCAIASFYIVVLLYTAVMLLIAGPFSLVILLSALMALPFAIGLSFAGASLGYLIQKSIPRRTA